MTRTVDKLIERLALLASGAEPESDLRGICFDVNVRIGQYAEDVLHNAFSDMGLHPALPLGGAAYKHYNRVVAWDGSLGRRRRALCKRAVFHLVKQHGYNGDWA